MVPTCPRAAADRVRRQAIGGQGLVEPPDRLGHRLPAVRAHPTCSWPGTTRWPASISLSSRLYMDFCAAWKAGAVLTDVPLPQASRGPIRDFAGSRARAPTSRPIWRAARTRWMPRPASSSNAVRSGLLYLLPLASSRRVSRTWFDITYFGRSGLRRLPGTARVRGASLAWLPEATVLRVDDPAAAALFQPPLRQRPWQRLTC